MPNSGLIDIAKAVGVLAVLLLALWGYGQLSPAGEAEAPVTAASDPPASAQETPEAPAGTPPADTPSATAAADPAPGAQPPATDTPATQPPAATVPPLDGGAGEDAMTPPSAEVPRLVGTTVGPDGQSVLVDPGAEYYRMGLYPEALALWEAAAAEGDSNAAYRLGVELFDGKPGVTARDVEAARRYFEMAAAKGDPRAQLELGGIFEDGLGVPASIETAASYYRKAALGGLAAAQWNIATMLETGEGVPKDEVQALTFYMLARAQGFSGPPMNEEGRVDQSALMADEALRARLTEEQIAAAVAAAKAFQPKPTP